MKLRRPHYADIAATLALVFALGGTAYAVASLPPDSVDTQSIQDGAVTNPKIAQNTIRSNRIKNNEVTTDDIADGSLTGADVADESLTSADLGVDSVQATEIADNSIDGGEIINGSLGGIEITDGSLTGADLADESVTGADIDNESLTLSDLVGANSNSTYSFSLAAGGCASINFGAPGAQVGQAVLATYTGTVAIPATIVFTPFRVDVANAVTTRACNVGSSTASPSGIGIRFVTFG